MSARNSEPGVLVRLAGVCLASLVFASGTGCGSGSDVPPPKIAPISGEVTFEDKPVAAGQVHFANDEQGSMFFGNIENGQFRAKSQFGDGIPLGKYKVKVTPMPSTTSAGAAKPADAAAAPTAADIPDKYRDFATSGFTADVTEGVAPFKFGMKKP